MTLEEFQKHVEEQNSKPKEKEADASDREFGLKLSIDSSVYQKIMHWVNKSDFEVSGLGTVQYDQDKNTLRVIDAILLPQKNTGTTTDIEPAAVNKAMYLLRNSPGKLKFWWHSHVNMGVFWSGTDIDTIKKLGAGGWFCATVFNKRREVKSAFCQNEPVRLLVSDIPTEIVENAALTKQWDEEYEKNVENVKWEPRRWDPSSLSDDDREELQEFLRQSKENLSRFQNEQKTEKENEEDVSEAKEIKQTKTIMIDGQPVQMEMFRDPSKKNLVPVPKKVSQEETRERSPYDPTDPTEFTSLKDARTTAELGQKSLDEWARGDDDANDSNNSRWWR